MAVVSMELTIFVFVFVFLSEVSLDFSKPLNEFFVLNLRKHLGNASVEDCNTRSGQRGEVRGHLSLILLESQSNLLLFTSSL